MLPKQLHAQGYFEPLCTSRHLSVRFYDWEPSRYVGDVIHLAAVVLCIMCLLREDGTCGVSFKAHLLYLLVFSSRFLNIFFCAQPIYLIIYKVLLWQGTLLSVLLMWIRGSIQDAKDTMSVCALLIPIMALTLIFGRYSTEDHGLVAEILWIFANHLEGFAMLPQYIYCYRDRDNRHPLVLAYIMGMGGYQLVFGLHWILRMALVTDDYLDFSSLINGVLGVALFADYILFKVNDQSPLSTACIIVDKGIQEARDGLSEAVDTIKRQLSGRIDLIEIPTSPAASPVGKSMVAEVEFAQRDVDSDEDLSSWTPTQSNALH